MIYGKVTIGSDTRTVNGIHRVVNRMQETAGGVIHSLSLYGERSGGGGAKTRVWAVIYADNAGVPGALLAVSSDFYDYGTSPEWHTFTGLSYHSTINTYYWIGYIAADKFVHYYDAGVADQLARAADSDTTPDNPFGTPTLSPDEMSCYITNLGGTQTVNPDGGEDYTSLSAWESTENGDIAGSSVTSTVNCTSSGTADSTGVTIAGWTTTTTYDMTIQQAAGSRHAGIWDDSKYRLRVTSGHCITINSIGGGSGKITFDGLQIYQAGTVTSAECMRIQTDNQDLVTVKNSIFRGEGATSQQDGIHNSNDHINLVVENCLFYDFYRTAIHMYGTATNKTMNLRADNNTFYNVGVGGETYSGAIVWRIEHDSVVINLTARNNLVRVHASSANGIGPDGVTNNGVQNITADYNSGNIADVYSYNTAPRDSGSPWDNSGDADSDYFLDAGADDFRTGTGDLHINVGDDLSGIFTDDCVGTDRGSGANTWDLGYFEFVPAGDGAPAQGLFMLISKTWMLVFPIAGVVKNNKMTRRELSNPMKWIE